MSYYSKTKKDKFEELTKIEQKRYEELIVNTRNSNKNIISSIRASLNKIDSKPNRGEIRKYSAESQRVSTPGSKQILPEPEKKLPPSVTTQNSNPRPVIKQKSVPIKRPQKIIDEQMKIQLQSLELQEKELVDDLNTIDQQGYKQRLFESLQAITEEVKEMEESSKGLEFKVLGIEKKETDLNNQNKVTEIKVKQFVLGQSGPEIAEEQEKKIEKLEENEGFCMEAEKSPKLTGKYANRGRVRLEKKIDAGGKRGASEGVMIKSQYSAESKISGYTRVSDKGSKENLKSVGKDYVRVNPKIDIKKLLYS